MSQINKEIENKIGIAEKLIAELENHRDQAANFQEVAKVLRELNEQIERLQKNYAAMEPKLLSEQLTRLQQQSEKLYTQTKSNGELASEIQQRITSSDALHKKWFIGFSIGLVLILLTTLAILYFWISNLEF